MLTRRKSRALKTAQENAKHNAEQSPLLALPDELFSAIFAFLPISSLFAARRICRVFSEIATNHVIRWIRRGPALYLYVSVRHPRDHGALVWSGHDLWPTKLQKSETMDDFLVYSVPDQSLFRRHLFFQCRACFTVSAAMIVRAGLRVADLAPDGFTDQGDGEIDVQLCWGDSGVLFPKWGKHSEVRKLDGTKSTEY